MSGRWLILVIKVTNYSWLVQNDPARPQVEASSQGLLAAKQGSRHTRYSQEFPKQMTGLHLAVSLCTGISRIEVPCQCGISRDQGHANWLASQKSRLGVLE
jgi:hypothetical protein